MVQKPHAASAGDPSPVDEALDRVRMIVERAAYGLGADAESTEAASSAFALERAISQANLSQHLRAALGQAATRNSESMEALRIAVCAFTVALRDEGVTPEAVLISIKDAIHRETLLPLWETSSRSGPSLHETITTWCINDYFTAKHCFK